MPKALNEQEKATVLAALQCFQKITDTLQFERCVQFVEGDVEEMEQFADTELKPLTPLEIDDLCERITIDGVFTGGAAQ